MQRSLSARWPFSCLVVAFLLLETAGVVVVLLTGHWQPPAPPLFLQVNPIIQWLGAFSHPIFPRAWFDTLYVTFRLSSESLFGAANLLAYSLLQWLGLAVLVDVAFQQVRG
jgi:hypothetical protein